MKNVDTEIEKTQTQMLASISLNDNFKESEFFIAYDMTKQTNFSIQTSADFRKDLSLTKENNFEQPSKPASLFTTAFLKKNGIEVRTVSQDSGSYIFTYPKTYTSYIGAGVYLSQHATFAPKSWLKHFLEGTVWLARNSILPSFQKHIYLTKLALYVSL